MLEAEFDKWHKKQLAREDALREVEDMVNKPLFTYYVFILFSDNKAFEELQKCWKKWLADRNVLILSFVTKLKGEMIKKGKGVNDDESVLLTHCYRNRD